MDKLLKLKLETTILYCQSILDGEAIHARAGQLDCIPKYLDVKTPTAAKRAGLVLKRGAKPVGTMEWKIPSGGYGDGKLYLGSKFKPKPK